MYIVAKGESLYPGMMKYLIITQKISSSPLSIVRRFHRFPAQAIQEPSPGENQTGVEIHKRLAFLSAVFPCRPINATDNK